MQRLQTQTKLSEIRFHRNANFKKYFNQKNTTRSFPTCPTSNLYNEIIPPFIRSTGPPFESGSCAYIILSERPGLMFKSPRRCAPEVDFFLSLIFFCREIELKNSHTGPIKVWRAGLKLLSFKQLQLSQSISQEHPTRLFTFCLPIHTFVHLSPFQLFFECFFSENISFFSHKWKEYLKRYILAQVVLLSWCWLKQVFPCCHFYNVCGTDRSVVQVHSCSPGAVVLHERPDEA